MKLFRKDLFWDVDPEKIDYKQHARFIIERVLSRGSLDDWLYIKAKYTLSEIKKHVVNIRSMDKKSLSFCSKILDIPREEFRCYINNAYWPPIDV
ncbi:MAG: hypothetical protein HQK83_18865 [Fibrobacteria bacterium]|nr:hypothetical protein [Fibrobacteria bacterium]